MTTPRQRILLDCDPGIDDAFALFCALKYTDLAAITTVSGNVSISNTTRNARYLMHLAGADVPVHRGASRPLAVPAIAADDIHGATGFGEHPAPDVGNVESPTSAVAAIMDFCRDGEATIVATGPLTNLALALIEDPTLAERIGHIYWMGGGTAGGNVTEHAEFNAWADPHAVDVTLQSGAPLTMFDLQLTHQVRMGAPEIEALRAADSASSSIFADVLDYYRMHGARDDLGQPMHDPCAVLGLTHPELFEIVPSHIVAHTSADAWRGKTEVSNPRAHLTHHVAKTAVAADAIELIIAAAIDPTPAL